MTDQEVQSQVTKPPRAANKWITFLKNYSQIHNLPYASCISSAECKQAYLASKTKSVTEPTPPTPPVVEALEAVEAVPETEPVETDIKKSKKNKKPKKEKKKKKKNKESEHSLSDPIDIPVAE